jgi:DNA polymerase/3'-5' exonuclease PolX
MHAFKDVTPHRRLDLIFVPRHEWACSLLYFTGSDVFNRSIRLRARNMGMNLSQHALRRCANACMLSLLAQQKQ